MKKGFFVLFLAALSATVAFGQLAEPHVCGNAQDQIELFPRLEQNKIVMEAMRLAASDRENIRYVPIHFHLVGDANGAGKHPEFRMFEQLCVLNASYEPVGVQFYLSEHPTYGLFNYSINNDNVYANQSNSLLMNLRRHPNAINVFVVLTAASGNNQPGTTLAYYNIPNDWIVCRKASTNGIASNSTMAHEVGHFFSLSHTFYGYENNSFDSSDPTWPKAPVMAPDFAVASERQNGTNCTTAADRICDTPPDYNFGFIWPNCSAYTGGAQDPLGVVVNPMENNYMSYFSNCNPYAFTLDQIGIMNADLSNGDRNYLDNSYSPVATVINTPSTLLVSPIGGQTTEFYDNVLLEWEAVPGATHYLINVDIISTFGTNFVQTFIVMGTSKLLTNLEKGKSYHWRVKPFNTYVACATSFRSNFLTSGVATTATRDIDGLNAWQLSPNPVRGNVANISIVSEKALDLSIRVTDAAGRVVSFQSGLSFPQGESIHELRTEGLANGLYFVSLESSTGRNVQKMSVLR